MEEYIAHGVEYRGADARGAILAQWASKSLEQRGAILSCIRQTGRCRHEFGEAEETWLRKWGKNIVPTDKDPLRKHQLEGFIEDVEVPGRAAWHYKHALQNLYLCYGRQRNATVDHQQDCANALEQLQYISTRCEQHLSAQKGARMELAGGAPTIEDKRNRKVLVDAFALHAKSRDKFMDKVQEDGMTEFKGTWKAVKEIPNGENRAKVGVFVKLDHADKIIDRIVKKTEYLYDSQWNSMLNWTWHGNPCDGSDRELREFTMQKKCHTAARGYFVGVRAWHQDLKKHKTTLYIEYCGYGDMVDGLTSLFADKGQAIPEPILWYIFCQLAYACHIMHPAGEDESEPSEDRKEIVHRDIKPENIFLDAPGPKRFRGYCTPKIGDFGHSIETGPKDYLNPHSYNNGAGTPGFRAPEQSYYADIDTDEPMDDWPLRSHTNIYAIGAVMMSLVWSPEVYSLTMYEPDFTMPFSSWKHSAWTKRTYSKDLLDLIDQCVEWEPSERITPSVLWTTIFGYIHTREDGCFPYLSRAWKGEEAQGEDDEFYMLKRQDKYKLSMVWDETAQMAAMNI